MPPMLGNLFRAASPDTTMRALTERSTDELIVQIDAGRLFAEIAYLWSVSASELNKWIFSDSERLARAELARRNQAALWDWVALQVLLQAPSDRIEIIRAERIAQHCRWRAAALSRNGYGQKIKVTQNEMPDANELTTQELERIARGGLLPDRARWDEGNRRGGCVPSTAAAEEKICSGKPTL